MGLNTFFYSLRILMFNTIGNHLHITVHQQGKLVAPAKPILRKLATFLNIPILNGNGNQHNTRSLGSLVVKAITEQQK